jgi:hypothetical protein
MFKRMVPLVVILAAMILAAPTAMAECYRCRLFPTSPCLKCTVVTFGMRFIFCNEDPEQCTCEATENCVTSSANITAPTLASEYAVVAVERLDDGQPSPQPLVASTRLALNDIH